MTPILGDWKLLVLTPGKGKRPPELFNLAEDIGEQYNLAAKYPAKVKALRAKYETVMKTAVSAGSGILENPDSKNQKE